MVLFINRSTKSKCKCDPLKLFLIKKHLSQEEMKNLILEFIDQYILCPKCELPEIYYEIEKEKLYFICRSCDYQKEKEHDKIVDYIIQNPPKKKVKKQESIIMYQNQEILFPQQLDFFK